MPFIAMLSLPPHLIDVVEIGQWEAKAGLFIRDCGAACVAMLLQFYGKLGNLTVDQLALETELKYGDKGLTCPQLVKLAALHGLKLKIHTETTTEQIYNEIAAGRPVIALIAYRYITGRWDKNDNKPFNDGHFLVIRGASDKTFIGDDPDYPVVYKDRGHNSLLPINELELALAGNNYHSQCLFVELDEAMITDQIKLLIQKNADNNAQILSLLAQVQDIPPVVVPPPVFPPFPPPAGSKVATTGKDGANVRPTPSIKIAKVGTINADTKLNVIDSSIDADTFHWWKIADGPWAGNYVANTTISFQ